MRARRSAVPWLPGLVALLVAAFLPAAAQAQSQEDLLPSWFDVSPRSQALGGAGVALPGEDPFASFLNPAHLADAEGLTWGHSWTSLLPGESEDVGVRANYFTLGAAGVGLSFDGRPFSALGKTQLDYGQTGILAEDGLGGPDSLAGEPSPFSDEVREFGLGFHGVQTLRYLGTLVGRRVPRVDDYVEISAGWRWKRFRIVRPLVGGQGGVPLPADSVEGAARDHGILLRVSPYHNIAGEVRGERQQDGGRLRAIGGLAVDLYFGRATLNSFADSVHLLQEPGGRPLEVRRTGVGLRLSTGLPGFLQEDESGEFPRLGRWLGPTLVLAAGYERIETFPGSPPAAGDLLEPAHSWGAELTVLDVASVRLGHAQQRLLSDDGSALDYTPTTWGFGLNLHYAQAVSVRYDWASVPMIEGPAYLGGTRHPWSWQVNVNPFGVLKVLVGEQ